jgi:hypothetical protein
VKRKRAKVKTRIMRRARKNPHTERLIRHENSRYAPDA